MGMYQTFNVINGVRINESRLHMMRFSVEWASVAVNGCAFFSEETFPEWLLTFSNESGDCDDGWIVIGESVLMGDFAVASRITAPGVVAIRPPEHTAELRALLDMWGISDTITELAVCTW